MKLITRDTDYSIRALVYMAKRNKKVISVSELVEKLKIPRPFLRKILQIMHKNAILNSYKGSGGGFSLLLPANRIYLMDLIEIFQGKLSLNECLFKKDICPNLKRCILRKKILSIERYILRELKGVTIASLLR